MDDLALLGALQLADSGFPSGAYVLSHGLETSIAEQVVRDANDLDGMLHVALLGRQARADLPILLAAHGAAGDLDRLIALDRTLSSVKLAREEREGSERVGRRLVIEAGRLNGSPALAALATAIEAGRTPGNSALVLGVAMAAFGVDARTAALSAASGFAIAFATAAVRMGVIGHGDAQRLVRDAQPVIVAAVERALTVDPADLRPSAPQLDIAAARHETAFVRAFAS